MDAVTAALSGLIDYAGLFPPAGLPLEDVVDRYGRYRESPNVWMLGRLILPAERLDEADELATRRGASPEAPWSVSALVGPPATSGAAVEPLARAMERPRALRVEAIEAVAESAPDIERLAAMWPERVERFVEIPSDLDPLPLMQALAANRLAAKIRAGGLTAGRFPTTAQVARFLVRARDTGVALKATAGLHHAIRGEYRLTYEPASQCGIMHGFVNLVMASALLLAGKIDEDLVDACLDDDRREVFKLSGRAGSWLNGVVTYSELSHARRALLRSVGSCSFEEPVAEIEALDLGLKGVDQIRT